MRVKLVPIEEIHPYPGNPRRNDKGVPKLAAAIREFGFRVPIIVDEEGVIVAGHTRRKAALSLGMKKVPVHVATGLSPEQIRAFRLADNRLHEDADWEEELLAAELAGLKSDDYDLGLTGFDDRELEKILAGEVAAPTDQIPEPPTKPRSKPGKIYPLGPHRLMCGDSTKPADVAKLLKGVEPSPMLHADPPYGMGKEAEGVANDNLNDERLDAFQMAWWKTWRPYLRGNASVYVWGNPVPLWRLWFSHLHGSEVLSYRNEIVWNKGTGIGQASEDLRCFSISTERVLFFMLGRQFFGNVNQADFFEGFEPIRAHLAGEAEKMGWGPADIHRLCGVQMHGHWFSRSQWCLIPAKHYATLREEAAGAAFATPYAELKSGHLEARNGVGHPVQSFNELRAHFDNAHDNMNEVWDFPRVQGEERWGSATPKPVALCARMVRSSSPLGATVLEPFGGTGSTLMACEQTGRACHTMELKPGHCDVIRTRYAEHVGDASLAP